MDFAQRAKELADSLTAPLPQSLFVEYLEEKCKFVLAKSKNSTPVLR